MGLGGVLIIEALLGGRLDASMPPFDSLPAGRPAIEFLADDPHFVYSRPCVSPSGNRVAFMRAPAGPDPIATVNSNFSRWTLWTVPIHGGASKLLFEDPDIGATRPDWSVVSNRIAFTGIVEGEAGLWILDPVTGSAEPVPLDPVRGDQLHYPSWFPDGERIAITDYRSHQVLEVWPDRREVRPLTRPNILWAGMAAVAPDPGSMPRVAFAGQQPASVYSASGNRIWIRMPDGSIRPLDDRNGRMPAWAPGGDRLAFAAIRARPYPAPVVQRKTLPPASMAIFVQAVEADRPRGALQAVSPPDHAAVHAKWHPSGNALVCTMRSLVSGRQGVVALHL